MGSRRRFWAAACSNTLDRARLASCLKRAGSFTPPERFDVKLELAARSRTARRCCLRQNVSSRSLRFPRRPWRRHSVFHVHAAARSPEHNRNRNRTGWPTRGLRHSVALARERLAALALAAPCARCQLTAGDFAALAAENYSLFQGQPQCTGEWQQLVERLRAQAGQTGARHIRTPDNRPESCVVCDSARHQDMATKADPAAAVAARAAQPLRAMAPPNPITGKMRSVHRRPRARSNPGGGRRRCQAATTSSRKRPLRHPVDLSRAAGAFRVVSARRLG